jgi:hypothetical protein
MLFFFPLTMSAMSTVTAATTAGEMHPYKKDEKQKKHPVLFNPFHAIRLAFLGFPLRLIL